eukprot:1141396-Pelagomonas_calceolata.AAC.1
MAVLKVQFMKLPGWSCAASYLARNKQESIMAAGVAPSLIRSAGFKELPCYGWRGIDNLRECGGRYPYDDILGGGIQG